MNSNDFDKDVKNLGNAVKFQEWAKVFKMYKEKKELRTAQITPNGDTALHIAVFSGNQHVVKSMVDVVCGDKIKEQDKGSLVDENGDEKNLVLGAQNDEGNTPLHLAALKGSVKMCENVGGADPLLIAKRNKEGNTPLFLAVLHGNKKAFLYLHYQYMERPGIPSTDIDHCIKRDNQDTILHVALEEKRIGLAIDIVLLYKNHFKELMSMRNRNGLSPLHLLAETPSIFESTDLPDVSFIARLLYHFVRVKKKEVPTRNGLEQGEHKGCFSNLVESIIDYISDIAYGLEKSCLTRAAWIVRIIWILLIILVMIPLIFPLLAEICFLKLREMKEKHTWSLQIIEELLQHASDVVLANPYEDDDAADSKIVDTPLMIAAQNGVKEMVVKILELFPTTMEVVNEEGKNIVLLAVEKRQTKLYQFLRGYLDINAFRQVDKDGNTAMHLAAMLGLNLNMQTTTMIEEFKWFDLVKSSVPYELRGKYNNDGKTAEAIFRESYKELNTSDRQWLNQTSQICPVASTVVASMAFSNFAGENIDRKNYPSLVALSLSLTSTICFLAILSFRSHSRSLWKYVPFMLLFAILTMIGSIVALWISLMVHGKSLTTYAILGSPIAILAIVSLPIFIGRTLKSAFAKVPAPNRSTTGAIRYRRPQKKKDEKEQTILCKILEALEDVQRLKGVTLN